MAYLKSFGALSLALLLARVVAVPASPHVIAVKRSSGDGFTAGSVSWKSGTTIDTLDNGVEFHFGGDGNLVVTQGSNVLWASYPPGTRNCNNGACTLNYQGDGNFVAYDASGSAFWSTGTNAYSGHTVASDGLYFSENWPWISIYSSTDSLMWLTNKGGSGSTSYNPGTPAPVSSNGLRYCSGAPNGWGDGSPVCVSGVSSVAGDFTAVMNGFNSQYCNGDWSGSISVHSASISEGGMTFSITNLPLQPAQVPYNDDARQPIDCSKLQSFFQASSENLIGCGQQYSFSCDYSPSTVFANSTWQYTASLYASSDLNWVLGGRNGQTPPKGSGTSSIATHKRGSAGPSTFYIDCGGSGGISCTSDNGAFYLI